MQASRPKSSPKAYDAQTEQYKLVPKPARRAALPSLKSFSIATKIQSKISWKAEVESPDKTKATVSALEDNDCSMLDEDLEQQENKQSGSPTKSHKPVRALNLETRSKPTRVQLFSFGEYSEKSDAELRFSAQKVNEKSIQIGSQPTGKPAISSDKLSSDKLQPGDESVCLSLRNIKLPTSQKSTAVSTRGSHFTSSMEFKRASMSKLAQPSGDFQIPLATNEFGLLESRTSLESTLGSKATIPGYLWQ